MDNIVTQAQACTDCERCLDSCPTYTIKGDRMFSPAQRLKTSIKVFDGEEIDEHMLESLYNCPKCMQCELVCPEKIEITRIVHKTREELVRRQLGPLQRHDQVIQGILTKGNSVNGDPKKRLDWLPGTFPKRESDTLLYLGCLPSYLVKDTASATYQVLEKLGADFMIIEDEGCCGTYIYETGRTDSAGELFQKNVERFKSLGIRKIIAPCLGCLKCFKYFYPDLLGEQAFTIHHVVEVIFDLLQCNPRILKRVERTVTYQDPCRLNRGEGITEEPRKILEWCGADLHEMSRNRTDAICCGAGGGIRSVYRDLSLDIATSLLNMVETETVVSACPFCVFNLRFASHEKQMNFQINYITKIVLDSLI